MNVSCKYSTCTEFIVGCLRMAVDKKWSIDKLESSNWATWKFQMQHLLLAKELWGHVDGTEVLRDGVMAIQFGQNSRRSLRKLFLQLLWP